MATYDLEFRILNTLKFPDFSKRFTGFETTLVGGVPHIHFREKRKSDPVKKCFPIYNNSSQIQSPTSI